MKDLSEKESKIIEHFLSSKKFISCVCIKWFKSAKKDAKNVKLKLLTKEDTTTWFYLQCLWLIRKK